MVVASHNPGKVAEIRALLAPFGIAAVGAGALGSPEPDETGASFADNAEIKARAAAARSGRPALADDSGLVIPALGGAPGLMSARWAGRDKDFRAAMARIERELGDNPDRRAGFVCALSLCWPDRACATFVGEVHGRLVFPARGTRGFGYDPIFIAEGESLTFGEMEPACKDAISHRARAFAQLADACLPAPAMMPADVD